MTGDTQPLQIRWLGHASVIVRVGEDAVLVDPLVRNRIGHLRRLARFDSTWLDPVDAILITHAHRDHLDLPSLRHLRSERPDIPIIAPPGADRVLLSAALDPVLTLRCDESVAVEGMQVTATPVNHDAGRGPGSSAREGDQAIGYLIRREGSPSVWIVGDTALFDEMEQIGPVDVAVVPIGGWWRTLGPGHLDERTAAEAVRRAGARTAIPVHWGTLHPIGLFQAMRAQWGSHGERFRRLVAEVTPEVDVRVLQVGEQTDVR